MPFPRLVVVLVLFAWPAMSIATDPIKQRLAPRPQTREKTHTDRYGDPLPPGAIARLGTVRFRHGYEVRWLAFSQDGTKLFSAGYQTIRLWDAKTGREGRRWSDPEHALESVALSSDGKLLAATFENAEHVIHFWDPASGKDVHPLGPATPGATRLAFSPDGKWLAAGDKDKNVSLWDLKRKSKVRQFTMGDWIWNLAFSPDSRTLAVQAGPGTVLLLDLTAGIELCQLAADTKRIDTLAFSPDSKMLATGSWDKMIHIWNARTGAELRRLKGHKGYVAALAFSPDGKTLASGGEDGMIRFWDPATGRELRRWKGDFFGISALTFSANGKVLAAGGEQPSIRLWEVAKGKERLLSTGPMRSACSVAFLPDGKRLVSVGEGQIGLWEALTGRELRILDRPDEQSSVGLSPLSPDGTKVATCNRPDRAIRLWDLATGKQMYRFTGKHLVAAFGAFSPDGRIFVTSTWGKVQLVFHKLESGKELRRLKGFSWPGPFAFSPDGRALAQVPHGSVVGKDYSVRLVDVATGKARWHVSAPPSRILALTFSPDGRFLAVAGGRVSQKREGFVWIFDASTGKPVRRYGATNAFVYCAAFSPDGQTLASGSDEKTIRLWEVATGQERRRLIGHQADVISVSFSPDGRLLASASTFDAIGLVWDLTGTFANGRFRPRRLSPAQLQACWTDLAAQDGAKAYRAILALSAALADAVSFLDKHLQAALPGDANKIVRLIHDLDNKRFAVREKAAKELGKLGEAAAPAMRRALQRQPTLEVKHRLERLLDRLEFPSGELLRGLRALEVLEHSATPEARQVLQKIAKGAPETRLTQEAKAALKRLARSDKRHSPA